MRGQETDRPVSATPNARRAAAYHEAGHTVVVLALGGSVDLVSIDEADAKAPERPGLCRYTFAQRFRGRDDVASVREERMEVEALAMLAGARAPILARCEGNYLDKTLQEHRLTAIMEILENWRPDGFAWDEMHAYLDWIDVEVTEMLKTSWPKVEAVARALLVGARLDGPAIREVAGMDAP